VHLWHAAASSSEGNISRSGTKPTAFNSLGLIIISTGIYKESIGLILISTGIYKESIFTVGSHPSNVTPDASSGSPHGSTVVLVIYPTGFGRI